MKVLLVMLLMFSFAVGVIAQAQVKPTPTPYMHSPDALGSRVARMCAEDWGVGEWDTITACAKRACLSQFSNKKDQDVCIRSVVETVDTMKKTSK